MKQLKIVPLAVIALLPLVLVSCSWPGGTAAVTTGWGGTTIQNGIVYTGTKSGRVVAVNVSSQSVLWPQTFASTAIYTTPTVNDGLVYVATYAGEVYALRAVDGAKKWVYPPKDEGYIGAVVGSLVLANGVVYTASSDGNVYAVNATDGTGKRVTDHVLAEKLWTSPAVMGDTLYVSTFDGRIYSLSAQTGASLSWSFRGTAGFASSPVLYGDTIFLGSFDRHLYAVKIGSDEPAWRFPQEKSAGNWFWACPIVSDDIVYAPCLDGKLYAVNATTGKEVWSYPTKDENGNPSAIVVSPVLMDSLLLVTNEAGSLYVFDLGTESGRQGVPLTTIPIGVKVNSSFCAQNGAAYIRGENDSLYVVDIGTGQVGLPIPLTG